MYAKVFTQIFDSSIADDYEVRHVFEDLLKLCDINGGVDMTQSAIARRTNVPLEIVTRAIGVLSSPDPRSRSPEHEGRRLIAIDARREWGWIIVNYEHYRSIQNEAARRAYYRDAKRREREKKKKKNRGFPNVSFPGLGPSKFVDDGTEMGTTRMEEKIAREEDQAADEPL